MKNVGHRLLHQCNIYIGHRTNKTDTIVQVNTNKMEIVQEEEKISS